MSRPNVIIKEQSIAGSIATVATGRIAYVVWSEKGIPFTFYNVANETDLANAIGSPDISDTTNIAAISEDYNVCKDILNHCSDLMLVRAVDPLTAQNSRIGIHGAYCSQSGFAGSRIIATGTTVYMTDPKSYSIISPLNDIEIYAQSPASSGNNISIAISKYSGSIWANNSDLINSSYKFTDKFEFGPRAANSEIALSILYNGVPVENFIVSLAIGNKDLQGVNNYIADYLEANSAYVWGFCKSGAYAQISSFPAIALKDGTKGSQPNTANYQTAYLKFANKNDITFDYIVDGMHSNNRGDIVTSICEARKDCIGFINAPKSTCIANNVPLSNVNTIVSNTITDRNVQPSSTWACYSDNWKQVYDKFQDKNIWIPMSPTAAGQRVAIDTANQTWIPAAGNPNGLIANIIKLAYNPTELQQDNLYKYGINYAMFTPGTGYMINGQKTMTSQNIGTARANIRNLFRIIEIAVGAEARTLLHGLNDTLTRSRFKAKVDSYLQGIQNAGGIVRFSVTCDETNNTDAVVNNYGFVADIKIEGKRAIENITLTFYEVAAGISFDELPG